MPYADRNVPWYEPAAATAMRKTEDRLRDLHPYAMARYDRLRADGMSPADAMREAAPLFARAPRAYDASYTPRPVLGAERRHGRCLDSRSPARPGPGEASAAADRPRCRNGAAGRSSKRSRTAPATRAANRSAKPSSAPSWKPSPASPPRSSTRSYSPAPPPGGSAPCFNGAASAERARAADLDAATDLAATPRADERTQRPGRRPRRHRHRGCRDRARRAAAPAPGSTTSRCPSTPSWPPPPATARQAPRTAAVAAARPPVRHGPPGP